MTDSDPPHEIDNGEPPGDRNIDAPDAYADGEEVADGSEEHHDDEKRQAKTYIPTPGRPRGLHNVTDLISDRLEGLPRSDDRRGTQLRYPLVTGLFSKLVWGVYVCHVICGRSQDWDCVPPPDTSYVAAY